MSRPVISVTPATTVKQAARLMVEHGISALPVLDDRGELVGIVSEADLVSLEESPDPRSLATPLAPSVGTTPLTVAEVMTSPVVTVPTTSEVSQAARAMLTAGVKRVPVMKGPQVVGIVSRRDLMRVIARDDEALRAEVARRIRNLGMVEPNAPVSVAAGIVTIEFGAGDQERRLLESIALEVPGVLEVRFAPAGTVRS